MREWGRNLDDKIPPGAQEVSLALKGEDLGAGNVGSFSKRENIFHARARFTLNGDHVRNLNNGVMFGLGKVALSACALDIWK